MTNLFAELMRIAKTLENEKDAELVRQAAVKCIPDPEPISDVTRLVYNYGFVRSTTY